jgi:hypothetical protein
MRRPRRAAPSASPVTSGAIRQGRREMGPGPHHPLHTAVENPDVEQGGGPANEPTIVSRKRRPRSVQASHFAISIITYSRLHSPCRSSTRTSTRNNAA